MPEKNEEIIFNVEFDRPQKAAQKKKEDDDKHFQQKEILHQKRLRQLEHLANIFHQNLAGWKMKKKENGITYKSKNDKIHIEIDENGKLLGISGKPPEKLAELAAKYAKAHPNAKLNLSVKDIGKAKEALAEFAKNGGNLDQVAGLTINGVQNNEKLKELVNEIRSEQLKSTPVKLR